MSTLPYKIAVLVYIFNDAGQLLLLHRNKAPNKDLYSPIGGKLEQALGESPYACALREIEEEVGLRLTLDDIRLLGIVSERAYSGQAGAAAPAPSSAAHWLVFCFEVDRRVNFPPRQMNEGRLEWIDPAALEKLPIPRTDRLVIWPLIRRHSHLLQHRAPEYIFSVHIDCTDDEDFQVTQEFPRPSAPTPPPDP